VANLFTSQTPGSADVNESSPVTVATVVYFTDNGTVSGGRFYGPATVGAGTYSLAFWQLTGTTTGTLLTTSADYGSVTAGAWNPTTFTPQSVTLNTPYVIGLRSSAGRYTATSNGLQSAGITNGTIVAPQTGTNPLGGFTINNGVFASGSISAFPSETFNGGPYFVDVDFTAAGDITPPSVPTSFATGTITGNSVALTWSASSDNVAVTGYEIQIIGP
jgi:hypothetical protein